MERTSSTVQRTYTASEDRSDSSSSLSVTLHPIAPSTQRLPGSQFSRAEREAIYADFQPLVRRLIRQYGDTPEIREDLKGEIYCRFCDLLEAYDPNRGVNLYAYLVRMLSTSTYAYARSLWRRRQR